MGNAQGGNVDWRAAFSDVQVATITPQTSLSDVLHQLTEQRLHRLYVVDDVEKSLGIITLTDLLRPLVPTAPGVPTEGPAGGLPQSDPENVEAEPMEPMHEQATFA